MNSCFAPYILILESEPGRAAPTIVSVSISLLGNQKMTDKLASNESFCMSQMVPVIMQRQLYPILYSYAFSKNSR